MGKQYAIQVNKDRITGIRSDKEWGRWENSMQFR